MERKSPGAAVRNRRNAMPGMTERPAFRIPGLVTTKKGTLVGVYDVGTTTV